MSGIHYIKTKHTKEQLKRFFANPIWKEIEECLDVEIELTRDQLEIENELNAIIEHQAAIQCFRALLDLPDYFLTEAEEEDAT